MKGYIEVNVTICGNAYYRSVMCCDAEMKLIKQRNLKTRNNTENWLKCDKCGAIAMEKPQEFICTHNSRKKSYDLSHTVYIKKR
jgi:hypothetical protein